MSDENNDKGVETPSNPWDERILLFSTAVGKTPVEITDALKPLVGEPGTDSLSILSDPQSIHDEDLHRVLVTEGPQIPLGVFRKNLPKLRGPQSPVASTTTGDGVTSFEAILPSVPEDESFLALLKVGGNLKPAQTEVISAIKAALANAVGLYRLPDLLIVKMEAFAESQDEPVGKEFFELHKLVTTRSYAEVLSVMGVSGSFVSEARKKAFLKKLDTEFWTSIQGFYDQLRAWQESWAAGAANPGAMMAMLLAHTQGGAGGMMPPNMMQPPETAGLRDAAEAVINQINKVFAGFGVPVSRALAYDATRIKTVLQERTLPASIGATNYEQMLKLLNVAVEADYVRLERNLTRFVLAVMEFPKVPSGTEEYSYLGAMLQLGLAIPWAKLQTTETFGAGIGGGRGARRDGQL